MSLIPAQCTNCGGNLTVDPNKEAAVCPFCYTPFITEKAINNYNTTNVTNIDNLHADIVKIENGDSVDNTVNAGETFILLKDYDSARKIFLSITEKHPYDSRGWWGMIRVMSEDFKSFPISRSYLYSIKEQYDKFLKVSQTQDISNEALVFNEYYEKATAALDRAFEQASEEILKSHDEYYKLKEELEPKIQKSDNRADRIFDELGSLVFIIVFFVAAFVCFKISEDVGFMRLLTNIALSALAFLVVGGLLKAFIDNVQENREAKWRTESALLAQQLEEVKQKCDNNLIELKKTERETRR